MVTASGVFMNRRKVARPASTLRFNYISPKRGRALLDRQARRYLRMSGPQFRTAYKAGMIPDPDRTDVLRVAMLLPFADD